MIDIFNYPDTNSARANIDYLNGKFHNMRIAIIGIGGTGSYILDLVSKTQVREIHIYDGDMFQVHNAFRAPGATPSDRFVENGELSKVEYFSSIYSAMHRGIIPHKEYITIDNIEKLKGFDFVFISIDSNEARWIITQKLLEMKVPFVDSGLGVNKSENALIGTLRVTVGSPIKFDHIANRIGSAELELENEYNNNIQIAELNCLNAVMAVLRWKKFCGFYQDLKEEHNSLFFINTGTLLHEDYPA